MSKNYNISHKGVNMKEVTIDSLSKLSHFWEKKGALLIIIQGQLIKTLTFGKIKVLWNKKRENCKMYLENQGSLGGVRGVFKWG